jgi:hypothetical protein
MTRDELTSIAESISWHFGWEMTYCQALDFAEIVAEQEREAILEMANEEGYVCVSAIRARGEQ